MYSKNKTKCVLINKQSFTTLPFIGFLLFIAEYVIFGIYRYNKYNFHINFPYYLATSEQYSVFCIFSNCITSGKLRFQINLHYQSHRKHPKTGRRSLKMWSVNIPTRIRHIRRTIIQTKCQKQKRDWVTEIKKSLYIFASKKRHVFYCYLSPRIKICPLIKISNI